MSHEVILDTGTIDERFDLERDLGKVFVDAVNMKTSDVHIVPEKHVVYIKFRIEGRFTTYKVIGEKHKSHLAAKIKILGDLKIDENRLPQDGCFTLRLPEGEIYLRISILPTLYGEKIVMRILNSTSGGSSDIEQLGFLPHDRQKIERNLEKKHGLVLIVGTTGSGKSTTILNLIKTFNPQDYNITTLEDPIEYRITGVTHSQVNHDIGFDFAAGLRSILRQDSDIIMVGEIRDSETAKLCMEAAITGHLVLSTIHANSSVNSVLRLASLHVDEHMIAAGMNLVVSQTLVRRLCKHCRVSYTPPVELRQKISEALKGIEPVKEEFDLYRAKE